MRKSDTSPFRAAAGFTLAELMIALPAYSNYVERARVAQAVSDILALNLLVRNYEQDNRAVPESLAVLGAAGKLDPWGRPYVYLKLGAPSTAGKARKNKNLVPINSDFDLYSQGRNGASLPPLTAQPSLDDVVLANDGGFAGLAADYVQ